MNDPLFIRDDTEEQDKHCGMCGFMASDERAKQSGCTAWVHPWADPMADVKKMMEP